MAPIDAMRLDLTEETRIRKILDQISTEHRQKTAKNDRFEHGLFLKTYQSDSKDDYSHQREDEEKNTSVKSNHFRHDQRRKREATFIYLRFQFNPSDM